MTTYYACSTARGPAGVAVIRVSGPQAKAVIAAMTPLPVPAPRQATLRHLVDPQTGDRLDQALLLYFAAPASFTGEDVAEFHVHGSAAVVSAVLAALGKQPGLVAAPQGAFTRQAFDNGKLDLAEVEGLADLVSAETEAQRKQALQQMGGGLSRRYEAWRHELIHALALLEAEIDFADGEDDVPAGISGAVGGKVAALAADIRRYLDDRQIGEKIRDGLSIAIIGAPNVGKSSLLNALSKRDVAIVSATPGTTRDTIEVGLNLAGYAVTLIDTAGLRETDDAIEAEGVRRARARAATADLVLEVVTPNGVAARHVESGLCIINKIDEHGLSSGLRDDALYISAKTGDGLPVLINHLAMWAANRLSTTEAPIVTRHRHRHLLESCAAQLEAASAHTADSVLAAESVRLAVRFLGQITGRVDVEDVLDVIFSSFCIGK